MHVKNHNTADFLVIGGGVVGVGLAYELARLGLSVILLERGRLGSGSSGSNQGGLRSQFYEPVNIRYAMRTLQRIHTFFDETGVDPGFMKTGYIFAISNMETAKFFREAVRRQNLEGVDSVFLAPEDLRTLMPFVSTSGLRAATYGPSDGRIYPMKVVRGFAAAARRAGARFYVGTPVTGVTHTGSTIKSVQAGGQTWSSRVVINAAGPWADSVSQLYGRTLPVRAHLSSVFHLGDRPGRYQGMPLLIDVDMRVTVCARWDGILVGSAQKPAVANPAFGPSADPAQSQEALRRAVHRLPSLAHRSLTRSWGGYWEVTPDDNPIIGWTHLDNLYTVAGFSGHGMCLVPGVLPVIAEELYSGQANEELAPYRSGRFSDRTSEAVEIWGGSWLARREATS